MSQVTILEKSIHQSDIPQSEKNLLVTRLKVASAAGVAAVVRDFNYYVQLHRAKVLPSHRHRLPTLLRTCPTNKKVLSFLAK